MRNTTQNQTKILGKNAKEKGDFERDFSGKFFLQEYYEVGEGGIWVI